METASTETVLVTGGTGFVAGWCIVELLRSGYSVRTTVRNLSREAAIRSAIASTGVSCERLHFFVADLLDDAGWDTAVTDCDYVLHVASPLESARGDTRDAFVAPARDGTLRVLRAAVAARVRRVVMTSAAATARPSLDSAQVSDETLWADPADPQFDAYRVSKILAERAAWDFMQGLGNTTEFVTILPGAVFGPILTSENLGSVQIIHSLLRGRPTFLPRLGFWIVDVRDLADLHIRAMTSPQAAGQRFLAAGEFLWMQEIAQILRARLGRLALKTPIRQLPTFVVKLLLPFMPQFRALAPLLGRKFLLTTEKARRTLGFSPRPAADTLHDCAISLTSQATPGSP